MNIESRNVPLANRGWPSSPLQVALPKQRPPVQWVWSGPIQSAVLYTAGSITFIGIREFLSDSASAKLRYLQTLPVPAPSPFP